MLDRAGAVLVRCDGKQKIEGKFSPGIVWGVGKR